ncbi:MAG: TetR/AcrR family transcriptional regulator [Gammaproteobacteria bacterium]|nr:TetR/AcrR family transcriptional regulator [Gammaproteobacteria bacterium]NNM14992.1 TetR/AcrR family transcriptional regulator [Gammaproteobacteria bacterium]
MPSEAKTTPRDRLEQREHDILSAASELFAEFGFNATSTKKIAAKAGVSEGTVFHYFSNKQELLTEIIGKMYADLTHDTNEKIQNILDTKARLFFLAENHVKHTAASNALLLRLVYVYINLDMHIFEHLEKTDLYAFNHRYTKIFDAVIKDGMHRGDLKPDINLSAVRDLFYGGLEYGIRTMMLGHKKGLHENHVHAIVAPVWESIRLKKDITQASSLDQRLELAVQRLEDLAKNLPQV